MKTLSNKQHPLVKHLTKLRDNRPYRTQNSRVVIVGNKMVEEVSKLTPIKTLLSTQELSLPAEQTFLVTCDLIKKISGMLHPEGVLAEVAMPPFQDLVNKEKILILDRIADPGNLGTLIRTALALGFEGIHLLDGCCDPFNDKALRSAKGATFSLPLGKGPPDLPHNLYAADLDGKPPQDAHFQTPMALILGNESTGISPNLSRKATKVAIPLHNHVDSLNVATAGAILMYEINR